VPAGARCSQAPYTWDERGSGWRPSDAATRQDSNPQHDSGAATDGRRTPDMRDRGSDGDLLNRHAPASRDSSSFSTAKTPTLVTTRGKHESEVKNSSTRSTAKGLGRVRWSESLFPRTAACLGVDFGTRRFGPRRVPKNSGPAHSRPPSRQLTFRRDAEGRCPHTSPPGSLPAEKIVGAWWLACRCTRAARKWIKRKEAPRTTAPVADWKRPACRSCSGTSAAPRAPAEDGPVGRGKLSPNRKPACVSPRPRRGPIDSARILAANAKKSLTLNNLAIMRRSDCQYV